MKLKCKKCGHVGGTFTGLMQQASYVDIVSPSKCCESSTLECTLDLSCMNPELIGETSCDECDAEESNASDIIEFVEDNQVEQTAMASGPLFRDETP